MLKLSRRHLDATLRCGSSQAATTVTDLIERSARTPVPRRRLYVAGDDG